MLVIVGLGNPGPRYVNSRHNVGFQVLAALAHSLGAPSWRLRFGGEVTRCSFESVDALLLRPQTWMNESGRSVKAALSFFRLQRSDLVVVHDELDLPFGTLRVKVGGGHAGHNGLRSIVDHLGSTEFVRLRVGIGRPPAHFAGTVAAYVLSDFDAEQAQALPDVIGRAVAALRDIACHGAAAAANRINVRARTPTEPTEVGATSDAELGGRADGQGRDASPGAQPRR